MEQEGIPPLMGSQSKGTCLSPHSSFCSQEQPLPRPLSARPLLFSPAFLAVPAWFCAHVRASVHQRGLQGDFREAASWGRPEPCCEEGVEQETALGLAPSCVLLTLCQTLS